MSIACRVCQRPLTSPISIKIGVGRGCAKWVNQVLVGELHQEPVSPKDYDGNSEAILKAERILRERIQQQRERGKKEGETAPQTTESNPLFQQTLYNEEQSIRYKDYETGIVYDKYGNKVWEGKGDTVNKVNVTSAIQKGILKDATFTHNHPSDSSFSGDDVFILIQEQIMEVRAVGRRYKHSIRLREDFRKECESPQYRYALTVAVKEKYTSVFNEVKAENEREIAFGHLSEEEAKSNHMHEVWQRVNQSMNNMFIYERKEDVIEFDQEKMTRLLDKYSPLKEQYDFWTSIGGLSEKEELKQLFNSEVLENSEMLKAYKEGRLTEENN